MLKTKLTWISEQKPKPYLFLDFVNCADMQGGEYLCHVRGGGVVALWAAEGQEGIWHITM